MSSDNRSGTHEPGHRDTREIEWQLASADLSPVRRWLASHPQVDGLTLQPDATVEIHDTYFDTDDWRIHRAGYALRIRTESGRTEATLKALHSARADVADRREVTEALESGPVSNATDTIRHSSGPVGRRVHAVSGAHSLVALFEVRTSREKFAVRQADQDEPLGEIALDETIICRPDGTPRTTLKRVEVEAQAQSHKPLQALVKSLRRECELSAAQDSKYSQGLKSAGLAPLPPASLSPTTVHTSMRMDEAVFASLRRYLAAWYQHEPGARLGDDPEELHDLRVAGRRLEALLRQFREYLPEALLQLRPVLRGVRQVLGEARDLDLALAEIEAFIATLPEPERQALKPLQQHLIEERIQARQRMLELLDSESVRVAFERLTQILARPAGAGDDAAIMAVNVAPTLLRTRFRKLRKDADALQPDSSMATYHEVRSQVKKLRYALETVAMLHGKAGDAMLRALRRWQEKLGIQQDADVAGRRLRAFVNAPPESTAPETLFLMGRLAEHHATAAQRARAGLPKAYRKVRQRWKKLRATFPQPPPTSAPNSSQEGAPAEADPAAPTAAARQVRSRPTKAKSARRKTASAGTPDAGAEVSPEISAAQAAGAETASPNPDDESHSEAGFSPG
ncbi:MAG: CHAD domain-containing protein [Sinobacteraceae bacterium]|nr:CHAD domain-containing protein [Nevskiaceae bacterium]